MPKRAEYALALLLDLLGGAGALLIAGRAWQRVVTPRARPLADDVLPLSGHTLDSAATALGLVALAGVVAVLATRGLTRRVLGARSLVQAKHSGVGVDPAVVPQVSVHAQWPVLSSLCGLLVLLGGLLVAARGNGWGAMSARYEAPSARPLSAEEVAAVRARADASMWTALDRGADPTSDGGSGQHE